MISTRAPWRSIRVLAVLAGGFVLTGCGSSHSSFLSHIERGKRYLAAHNLDKASIEFRNALQIDPRNADAFYFNGKVAERRGDIRAALEFYQAAIDAQPDDTLARAGLAKVLVLGGATSRSLEVISPGLLDHPDDAELLAARAVARHELKDDINARADAERAVQLAPTNENAIAVLAALSLRAGATARAVSLVSDAVGKAPDSVDLRQILANVFLSSDQPRQAEEQMRKIIALEPNDMAPRIQLATHFARAHDLDAAQRVLEAAVRDLPETDAAKLALVDFITTQRSPAEGKKTLQDFIAREPANEDLRLALGTLLQRGGATQEAVATFREVIRRGGTDPKGLAARDRVAAIEISLGHADAAKQLIAEVLVESSGDDDALIMRAEIELAHDDPTNAIVDLRTVLHDQPKSVPLLRSLARAYLAKGEVGLAEDTLRAAVEAAPQDVSTKIAFARFLMQAERTPQAVTLLEETVHGAPSDARAREELVHAYIADRNLPAARTAAEDLQALRPDSSAGYYLAGLIAHDENRPDESEKSLERALELQPGSIEILTTLTRFDLERGHGPAAVARLKRSLDRDSNNVQLLDLLGGTYLEAKDLTHAAEVLSRAVTLDPRSWVAYTDLARVRLAAGDTSGALESYQMAFKVAPTQLRVVTELAAFYEKSGRIDAAIASYDALYKSGDSNTRQFAANNLAMLLVSYKTDPASLNRARALTVDFSTSGNASFLDTLGWVHFKRREYRDAVIALERAADRSPESKVIRYHLGMVELRLGERERARRNLESALSGSGSFIGLEEARSALATLEATRPG